MTDNINAGSTSLNYQFTNLGGNPLSAVNTDDGTGIKDSGERQKFETGAQRDIQGGKGFFHLLPFAALFLVSRIYEDGAIKYEARNWEKGIPLSRYVDSAIRHLSKYMDGMRDEPHLSQAGWNILCAIWTAAKIHIGFLPKELNDLPHKCSSVIAT